MWDWVKQKMQWSDRVSSHASRDTHWNACVHPHDETQEIWLTCLETNERPGNKGLHQWGRRGGRRLGVVGLRLGKPVEKLPTVFKNDTVNIYEVGSVRLLTGFPHHRRDLNLNYFKDPERWWVTFGKACVWNSQTLPLKVCYVWNECNCNARMSWCWFSLPWCKFHPAMKRSVVSERCCSVQIFLIT